MTDDILRYPIGKFSPPLSYTEEDLLKWTETLRALPAKVRNAVMALNEEQLGTPYRPGGWTIRQVIHHIPDSHMNALVRIKWTLTEENPTIKPYREADWALLSDYQMPIEPSLKLLDAIHLRLVNVLEHLTEDQLERTFVHPDTGKTIPVKQLMGMYAWHGKHHLAHITNAIARF